MSPFLSQKIYSFCSILILIIRYRSVGYIDVIYKNLFVTRQKMTSDFNPQKFIGMKFQDVETTFTENDAIIYALGIGYNQDPLKQADFKFTYEMSDNFSVFPTFGTCFHKVNLIGMVSNAPGFPSFNPAMLLHAEQKLQMIAPALKPNLTYVTRGSIKDIIDKGKMTLVCLGLDVFEKVDGQLKPVLKNQTTLALLKFSANGYKGKGNMSKLPSLPKRNPDLLLEAKSYPSQAILYRLTGDTNPLHIDPNFAAIQKLPKPIIHGLATKGIIARTLVENLLDNDSTRLKSIHCRFAGHVFPGESFQISVWKEKDYFAFSVKCKERGTTVLTGVMQARETPKL